MGREKTAAEKRAELIIKYRNLAVEKEEQDGDLITYHLSKDGKKYKNESTENGKYRNKPLHSSNRRFHFRILSVMYAFRPPTGDGLGWHFGPSHQGDRIRTYGPLYPKQMR